MHIAHKNSPLKANRGFLPPFLAFTAILLRIPNRWTHPMFLKLQQVLYDGDFDSNAIAGMEKHYERVRSLVPPVRLLEHTASDGWGPLSAFLDKPVPAEEAPHINSSRMFVQRDRRRTRRSRPRVGEQRVGAGRASPDRGRGP